MNRMHEVHIRPVLNGFIVTVGGQQLVFNDIKTLANELTAYHKNPDEVEKFYRSHAVNQILPPTVEPSPPVVGWGG